MPLDCPIKDHQTDAIKQSFESIFKFNLCALSDIPKHVLVNPVTQTQSLDGNICVNYVNLSGASKSETKLALETAVFEEYCGVYGISLERQWAFQRFSCPDLLKKEASERLMSCVVFILKPPTLNRVLYQLPGTARDSELAYYQARGNLDGFSQDRNRSVISAEKLPPSNRITEIKTTHSFPQSEMLAILVPEHLVELAQSVFKSIKIIPVPTQSQTLKTLPDILSMFHGEEISKPLMVDAPDFLNTLLKWTQECKIPGFSLHAVRLHTTFDFTIRSIKELSKHQAFISEIQANIFTTYSDDSGWIMVHKNFGLSKKSFIASLVGRITFPPDIIDKIRTYAKLINQEIDQTNKRNRSKPNECH